MKAFQILVLMIGFALTAYGQASDKAVLSGTVYDINRAVIPGINVVIVNQKGERFERTTDENGDYWFYLPISKYEAVSKDNRSNADRKLNTYEITFDNPNRGIKKFIVKDFALAGKMQLDVILEFRSPEPCDYGGDGCSGGSVIESTEIKIPDKFVLKPVEELPEKQNVSGLCGTVFDKTRAILPRVAIKAKSYKKGVFRTTTDAEGNFELEIPDGLYKIIMKKSGFKKVVMKNQSLPYETNSCRNFILISTAKVRRTT